MHRRSSMNKLSVMNRWSFMYEQKLRMSGVRCIRGSSREEIDRSLL